MGSDVLTGRTRFRNFSGGLLLQVEWVYHDPVGRARKGWRDACVEDLTTMQPGVKLDASLLEAKRDSAREGK
jgi:hypothetical protein